MTVIWLSTAGFVRLPTTRATEMVGVKPIHTSTTCKAISWLILWWLPKLRIFLRYRCNPSDQRCWCFETSQSGLSFFWNFDITVVLAITDASLKNISLHISVETILVYPISSTLKCLPRRLRSQHRLRWDSVQSASELHPSDIDLACLQF